MPSPFADIRALVADLPPFDERAADAARRPGLGAVGEAIAWVAGVQGRDRPTAERALVALFISSRNGAGTPEAARARLAAFTAGSAPINAVCATGGLGFRAFDLAADLPAHELGAEPAASERDCVATMAFGMEAVAGGADLLALGDGSPGADAGAAAILAALGRDPPGRWASGAELGPVTAGLLAHGGGPGEPLAFLASLGGREVAALAGAILAARHGRVPVLLDGLPALAAAAVLHGMRPDAVAHCRTGSVPARPAAAHCAERIGLPPLLPGLRLPDGEGIGAALALGLVRAGVAAAAGAPA